MLITTHPYPPYMEECVEIRRSQDHIEVRGYHRS